MNILIIITYSKLFNYWTVSNN